MGSSEYCYYQISYKHLILIFYMGISDKEKEEIRKEAKQIMDSFAKKLEKIENKLKHIVVGIERDEFERGEGGDTACRDDSFDRDVFFDNAPNKDKKKGVILAEKKGW